MQPQLDVCEEKLIDDLKKLIDDLKKLIDEFNVLSKVLLQLH